MISIFLNYFDARDQTQGFVDASQAFYSWATSSALFCFNFFNLYFLWDWDLNSGTTATKQA
jgi:hypothetical protein